MDGPNEHQTQVETDEAFILEIVSFTPTEQSVPNRGHVHQSWLQESSNFSKFKQWEHRESSRSLLLKNVQKLILWSKLGSFLRTYYVCTAGGSWFTLATAWHRGLLLVLSKAGNPFPFGKDPLVSRARQ